MWSELRTIVGVGLVCCIVVLVISPFGDVPVTTLQTKQLALFALAVLALCWNLGTIPAMRWAPMSRTAAVPFRLDAHATVLKQTRVILC